MPTFEITVRRGGDSVYALVADYTADNTLLPVRAEGSCRIDEEQLRALGDDPPGYGAALGQALFQPELRDAFAEALGGSGNGPLRLLLFVDVPELARLRWERLCAPVDGRWCQLATFQRTPFSHYLPSLTDRRFPQIGRSDLRALLVSASPPGLSGFGLGHFDAEAALAGVRANLAGVPTTVLSTAPDADGPPTLDELCRRLTAGSFTLLHLVCHGRALPDGESVIYLARGDDPREVDPVTATRLLEQLNGLQGAGGLPHLAFLCTCESAIPAAAGAMGGLAHRLVRELGLPAVVAMSDKVSVDTANALAANFYTRLLAGGAGEPDRALVEATAGLAERPDITVPALFSRLGGRRLFDESIDRPLSLRETIAGLDRLKACVAERAPILAPALVEASEPLRQATGALGLADRAASDLARARVEQICAEATERSFAALARGAELPPYDARCPFPGLSPFQADDKAFFFGREAAVHDLAGWLDGNPCLAVIGPSGSGKSSLVRAGLMPELQRRTPGLRVAWCTPGELPLSNLTFAIEEQRRLAAAEGAPDAPIAVLVDQLEELFTLCSSAEERASFIDELARLPHSHRTVLAMRSDFLGECGRYKPLNELVIANIEQIGPLTPDELRNAMERQAAAVGLRFEAGLSGKILDDVSGEPGAMPLLQHALHELWLRRRGRWLRGEEYAAIGGIQRAIAHTADQIFQAATAEERARLRDLFVRLTRIDQDGQDEDRRDTRQRVAFGELVPVGVDPALTQALINRLAASRLVVAGAVHSYGHNDADEAEARNAVPVEVAHEALIRSWPRLQGWLTEDRSALLLRASIRRDLHDWGQRDRDAGSLLRGGKLEEALRLLERQGHLLNTAERAFIQASAAERDRALAAQEAERQAVLAQTTKLMEEQRARAEERDRAFARQQRLARFLRIMVGVAILAAVFSGYLILEARADRERAANLALEAIAQREQANQQRATAEAERARADQAAAEAERQADQAAAESDFGEGDTELALAYATRALQLAPDDPRSERLFAEIVAAPGTRLRLSVHESAVAVVAFNPNRLLGLSGDEDGVVLLWNLATGQEMDRYDDSRAAVAGLAFAPNGDSFVVGRDDGALALHRLSSARSFAPHDAGPVTDLAFTFDGSRVLSAHASGRVLTWDATTGQRAGPALVGHTGPVNAVATVPGPDRAVTAGEDGTLRVWDLATGAELRRIAASAGPLHSLALSPDGSRAFTGGDDGPIGVWDVAGDGGLLATLRGHTGGVLDLAVYSIKNRLVSASWDGTVRLWDLDQLRETRRFVGHTSWVRSVALSAFGDQALSGAADNTLRLWDLDSRSEDARYALGAAVAGIAVAPGGARYYTVERGGRVSAWDAAAGSKRELFPAGVEPAVGLALSPSGRLGASGIGAGEIRLWDTGASPPAEIGRLRGHTAPVTGLAFSPDGAQLVSGGEDGAVVLWDVARQAELARHSLRGRAINAVAMALGGARVAIAADDAVVRFWDPATGDLTARYTGHLGEVLSLAVSPDGTQVATGSLDRSIVLWRAATAQRLRSVGKHNGGVLSLAFSPDGQRLASSSYDGTVRLWDVGGNAERRRFSIESGAVLAVAVVPAVEGGVERLLTGSSDGVMLRWNVENLDSIKRWAAANRYMPSLTDDERRDLSARGP